MMKRPKREFAPLPRDSTPLAEESVVNFDDLFKILENTLIMPPDVIPDIDYSQFLNFNACDPVDSISVMGM